jgi:putative transcriptional regulator
MDEPRFYTGQMLLAMPGIGDPRFSKAVIAMCVHDEEGALGIGVGAHLPGVTLHGLLAQFDIAVDGVADIPIFAGGPVEPQRGFVLHSLDWGGQGTADCAGKWGLSSTIDVLRVIGRPNGPSRWLVALGYAGWGAGQLDAEMTRHGWHLADGNDALMFDTLPAERWQKAFEAGGIDPRLLVGDSGTA